jgi:FkbM family methyltransferase
MEEALIYDVGLHTGEDTEFYLRKGFSVVGIEADPTLIAAAKSRFHEAITRGRLHLIEGAVAPASAGDPIVFYANPHSDWGTILPNWASRNELLGAPSKRIEVKRVDIAEIFRAYGVPFYLKVDIEGVDREVFEALKDFPDRPRYVSLESDKVKFSRLRAEMDLLRNLGYTKFKVVQQQTIAGMRVRTHTRDGQPFDYEFGRHSSGPFGEDLPLPWLTYHQAIKQYRAVFRRYKYFGDRSMFRTMPLKARNVISRLYRKSTRYNGPLPGWFDTHASL